MPMLFYLFVIACLGSLFPTVGYAKDLVVGVNFVVPGHLSVPEQNAVLTAMKSAGVRVIRAPLTPDDKGLDFAKRAYAQDIQIDWIVDLKFRSDAPRRTPEEMEQYDVWDAAPLSSADPEQFRVYVSTFLEQLEQNGIVLAGFELGNEINTPSYNGDFALPGEGKVLGLNDLYYDPEGQRIARGYLQYLKVLGVLKDVRDRSRLNQGTPVISGGLTVGMEEGSHPAMKKDAVTLNATLQFWRANGLDELVDAYGVHVYPWADEPGQPGAAAERQARLEKFSLAECRPARDGRPCWITEWGFRYEDQTCPPSDEDRHYLLIRELMGDFRAEAARGRVTGLFYFAWNKDSWQRNLGMPWNLDRCGPLTESGRLAIDGSALR